MRRFRRLTLLAVVLLIAAGCSNKNDNAGGGSASTGATGGGANTGSVNVLSALDPKEAGPMQNVFDTLINSKTDYKAEIEADANFEQDVQIRAQAGTLDVILLPQPGAVVEQAKAGNAVSLEDMGFNIDELNATFGEYFMSLGEYNGKHYGIPTNINLKSMVWYPKDDFDKAGYKVPTTWDEMLALSDQIVADGGTPWCVGFESGSATGWPATDWIEDIMLRTAGLDTYAKWATHQIPFNDPSVLKRREDLRRCHVPPRLRAGWGRPDPVDRVRRRAAADVRQPTRMLAAPSGELHQLVLPCHGEGRRRLRLVPASSDRPGRDAVRR